MDLFKWYVDRQIPAAFAGGDPYANLEREASKLAPGVSGLMALDWHNGNRNVLGDPLLSGGKTAVPVPASTFGGRVALRNFHVTKSTRHLVTGSPNHTNLLDTYGHVAR